MVIAQETLSLLCWGWKVVEWLGERLDTPVNLDARRYFDPPAARAEYASLTPQRHSPGRGLCPVTSNNNN